MKNILSTSAIAITILAATQVSAATITLKNGDVFTGEVLNKVDGELIISHPSIGGLSIAENQVVSITDAPVEPPKPKKPNETFDLRGGGLISDGNTNQKRFNLQGDYKNKVDEHRYTLSADINFGESEGDRDVDNTALLAKYDYFFADKWYWANSLDYYRDDFQNIDTRISFSSGLGYQFIDNETTSVLFELGPSIVYEKNGNEEGVFAAGRWMVDATHTVIADRLEVFHKHTGLLSFEEFSDVSIRAETGVKLPIYGGWDAFAQMNNNWEGAPVTGSEDFDTTYLFGVGYKW